MVYKNYRKWNALLTSARVEFYSRRVFLERTVALGLAGTTANMLLAGCTSSPEDNTTTPSLSKPTTIYWSSENDEFGICYLLADHFNKTNSDGITVIQRGDQEVDDLLSALKSGHHSPDVLSLDVIWIDEFVNNKPQILSSLSKWWKEQIHNSYLPITMQSATSANGEIWAAPFRTDMGLLYYRKDIVASPPKTWDELVTMALQAMDSGNNKDIKYGYVWEETGEGLVCCFVEVLSSFGGSILDKNGKPIINQGDAALNALNEMCRWIALSVSPQPPLPTSEEVYAEEEARGSWAKGNAVFMRNWPYAIAMSDDVQQSTKIVDKFGVAPLPSNARSCIGGWQLAINKNSPNQDAAQKFIKWMLQTDAQQYGALRGSFAMAQESIYEPPVSSYVIERNPFFGSFKSIIDSGQLRPRSSQYLEISQILQENIRKVLSNLIGPEDALQIMQAYLERILSNK